MDSDDDVVPKIHKTKQATGYVRKLVAMKKVKKGKVQHPSKNLKHIMNKGKPSKAPVFGPDMTKAPKKQTAPAPVEEPNPQGEPNRVVLTKAGTHDIMSLLKRK
jgi:hypothetical protein